MTFRLLGWQVAGGLCFRYFKINVHPSEYPLIKYKIYWLQIQPGMLFAPCENKDANVRNSLFSSNNVMVYLVYGKQSQAEINQLLLRLEMQVCLFK